MDNENSDLEDIRQALLRLQALKIELVFDFVADATLLCTSFDQMNEVMAKCNQEIEDINSETEKQLRKYKTKG